LAKTEKPADDEASLAHVEKHLELLEDRLDNIDSMVTAVAERVMSQLITVIVTCPRCGKDIEISIVGSPKPGR